MDVAGSLLEEGISQQTLNELLGLTDDTEITDDAFAHTLDLGPPFGSSSNQSQDSGSHQAQFTSHVSSAGQTIVQNSTFLSTASPVIQQQVQGHGHIQGQGQILGQGQVFQQTLMAGTVRETQSPILTLNSPRSSSPIIIRPPHILPKPAQSQQQQAQLQLPQPLAAGQLQRPPLQQGSHVVPSGLQPAIVQQGGKLVLPQGMRLQGQNLVIGSNQFIGQRTVLSQNVLNSNNVLNVQSQQQILQQNPTILQNTNLPNAQIIQNPVQSHVVPSPQFLQQNNLNLQTSTIVQNSQFQNQNLTLAPQNVTLQSSQILAQNAQNPSLFQQQNPSLFPQNQHGSVNVNSSGNSVNLLNLNAQPGSQIVIHGNPANSQGSIILGTIPGQLIQMNSAQSQQPQQKLLINTSGMQTAPNNNFVLTVGGQGLNLQGTSLQPIRPVGQQAPPILGQQSHAQKPMANVVGQRQVARCAPTSSQGQGQSRGQGEGDIMSQAMTLSDIDEEDLKPGKNGASNFGDSKDVSKQDHPIASSSGLQQNYQRKQELESPVKSGLPTASQAGLAIDSKVQTVIPLSPQIQTALQKVQAEIKNLQLVRSLDESQQHRLTTLKKVQDKIIQHARDQAAKLQRPEPLQSNQISQSDQNEAQNGGKNDLTQLNPMNALPRTNQVTSSRSASPGFQSAFIKAQILPAPNVTVTRNDLRTDTKTTARPVAAIAPMQPRTVASVQPAVRSTASAIIVSTASTMLSTGNMTSQSTSNLQALLNPSPPVQLSDLNAAGSSTLSSLPNTAVGVSGVMSAGNVALSRPLSTQTLPMSTTSMPLSTSIGGITRIGIVKASDIGSPTSTPLDLPGTSGPTDVAGINQIPVPTQIKVGTHVLNMVLTPDQKAKIESHLARMTPQQQETVFQNQQMLLARSQKLQLKPTGVAPPTQPVIPEGVTQAKVVSSNPLTLKLLSQPATPTAPPSSNVVPAPPTRGVKRPLPTPQPTLPSKIAMVRQELENDRRAVVQCHDKHQPFTSWLDICQRLSRYHICTEMEIPEQILYNDDVRFEEEASTLMSKSRMLMNQFRRTLLESSMKDPMSCERHMMERIFIESEKEQLRKDKDLAARYPELFIPTPKPASPPTVIDLDSSDSQQGGDSPDRKPVTMDTSVETVNLETINTEDHDSSDRKEYSSLRIEPPTDDLNTNIKLSPVSPASPQQFNIPSLDWAPSPSEQQKAPLKLVLRKSGLGFQNLSSPAPNDYDNESENETDVNSESADDDDIESDDETENQEDSASTEVDESSTYQAAAVSEYTRRISEGFEAISDDDDANTPSVYDPQLYPDQPQPTFIGNSDFFDFDDGAGFVDLGDQMQNAIDSILSLQQTDDDHVVDRPRSVRSELVTNRAVTHRDDLDAAVKSILF